MPIVIVQEAAAAKAAPKPVKMEKTDAEKAEFSTKLLAKYAEKAEKEEKPAINRIAKYYICIIIDANRSNHY